MTFNRRSALKTLAGALVLPVFNPISNALSQTTSEWTTYEIVTEVNLESPKGFAETWIPLPLVLDTDYFKTLAIRSEASDPKVDARLSVIGLIDLEKSSTTPPSANMLPKLENRSPNPPPPSLPPKLENSLLKPPRPPNESV